MELAILEILWGDYMHSQQAAASRSMFDEAQGMGEKAAKQRGQQSDDEKLLQIDWSHENRRMPTQRKLLPVYNLDTDFNTSTALTDEQRKLSKIPMTGWSAMERDVARVLFHNDLLEYDSDATEEAEHEKEDRPLDLSTDKSKCTPPTRQ